MVTRKFDQEWDQTVSQINRRVENNVIFDFFDYLVDMHKDLKALKKDYEKEFNKYSKKSLDHYINLFERRLEQYGKLCIANHSTTKMFGHNQSYDDFRDGLILQNGNHHKIADKFYPVLKKIAESVFAIEDEMALPVSKLWDKEFTKIDDYSLNGNYFLLAHTSLNPIPNAQATEHLQGYFNSQNGMCFSLITNKKTRLYDGPTTLNYNNNYSRGLVGIIAKPKPGAIIAMAYDDMLSTEYIDGKCPLNGTFHHSNVNVCYENGNSKICCRGTKICPPNEIFNISVDTINEIVLDKSKMEVEAVFYVADSKNDIPEVFKEYKKNQEKIYGHKLKTIQLSQRNYLKQINLDELYDMH